MEYLVTNDEMREYDNNTRERIGVPAPVLMERAALAVRDEILRLRKNGNSRVLIAVGSGNNGADGLALARLLSEEGFEVSVIECGDQEKTTESYRLQRHILNAYHVRISAETEEEPKYDYVVDGIFGVGLSRLISDDYTAKIEWLNGLNGIKIAIDIPSGIDGTSGRVLGCAFRADVTVTFGFAKRGMYLYPGAAYAGRIVVAKIGIDEHSFFGRVPTMFTYNESPETLLPIRRKDGNKGTFGKVLLIAGWENMAGAAILSGKAVLETGAGMLKVFCSEQNRSVLQCAVPEAMYGNRESLKEDIAWSDVIVIGPGLGRSAEASDVLKVVLSEGTESKKLLLDADALNILSCEEELQVLMKRRMQETALRSDGKFAIIMTPHVGELSRISGKEISYIKSHPIEVAKEVSLDYDSVMVCKDARTIVCAQGEPFYLNRTGNSGMGTAGSGDVLSGIIGALLAQGMEPFAAATVGVYLHGIAGDYTALEYTEYGVTATRMIEQIRNYMKG